MTEDFDSMILDLAGDDFTGLWEFVWGAAANVPKADPQALLDQLRSDVELLIRTGKLRLYRGTRFTGEQELVADQDAAALLAVPANWAPPEVGRDHLRVLTNEATP